MSAKLIRFYPDGALTPLGRALLFAEGVWTFSRNPEPVTPATSGALRYKSRNLYVRKNETYGAIVKLAERYVAGEFGEDSVIKVAEEHGCAPESLRKARYDVIARGKQRRAS